MYNRLLLTAASLVFASTNSAYAAIFVLTDTGGAAVGTQARAGFEIATAYWSSVLADHVTVNLNIGSTRLGANVLGQASSETARFSMNQIYTALRSDRTSALDSRAVATLQPLGLSGSTPGAGAVSVLANDIRFEGYLGNDPVYRYSDTKTRIDNDGSVNNSITRISKASAKALGLTSAVDGSAVDYNSVDASITFSDRYAFDYDPSDGINVGTTDFLAVAIHEIGHALGFYSGVDEYDANTYPYSSFTPGLEGNAVASQLDLFRYSSAGKLDWSTQNTPYFSIDGGVSQLFGDSRFATGVNNGDGTQASHWKDAPARVDDIGIMSPTIANGQQGYITALDLAGFDAIGWDLKFDVLANPNYRVYTAELRAALPGGGAVPEPTAWVMLVTGFGLVGGLIRKRRCVTTLPRLAVEM